MSSRQTRFFSRHGCAFGSRWLHILVGITWIGLLYYFNFVQVPAFAAFGDEAPRPATSPSTSWPARRCGGSAGRRSPRSSPASLITGSREGLLLERASARAPRRLSISHRHAPRHDHVPQRVGRDLAQPEGRARQRRQRARRRRGRPDRRGRRPQGRAWRPARTRSSRCTMLFFMVVHRRTAPCTARLDLEQRQGGHLLADHADPHRRARAERPRPDAVEDGRPTRASTSSTTARERAEPAHRRLRPLGDLRPDDRVLF